MTTPDLGLDRPETDDPASRAPVTRGRVRAIDPDALRDVWPMVLGVVPFGLLIGMTLSRMHLGAALG